MTQRNNGAFSIVPLDRRHILEIEEIEQECFTDPWSHAMIEGELETPLARYFVCETPEGRVLGYLGTRMILDVCEITNVAVRRSFRRLGLAGAMYRALEAECRRLGVRMINLEVRESNLSAQAFYRVYGFVPVGKRKNYYDSPRETAILMSRLLEKEEPCNEHTGD